MKKQPIPIGSRCELLPEGLKGKVTKSGAQTVRGVFDDGTPWTWSRAGFIRDFRLFR